MAQKVRSGSVTFPSLSLPPLFGAIWPPHARHLGPRVTTPGLPLLVRPRGVSQLCVTGPSSEVPPMPAGRAPCAGPPEPPSRLTALADRRNSYI